MTRITDALSPEIQHILKRCLPDERTGIRALQRAADLPQDGILTRNQAVAINKLDQRELCAKLLAEKLIGLVGLRNFDDHGRRWFTDVAKVAMDLGL